PDTFPTRRSSDLKTIYKSREMVSRIDMFRHFMVGNVTPNRRNIYTLVNPVIYFLQQYPYASLFGFVLPRYNIPFSTFFSYSSNGSSGGVPGTLTPFL